MAQRVKALAVKVDNLSSILRTSGSKARTDFCKLPFDFHTCASKCRTEPGGHIDVTQFILEHQKGVAVQDPEQSRDKIIATQAEEQSPNHWPASKPRL